MSQPVKAGFWSRYFKLRIGRSTLITLLILITTFLVWFYAFPQFGPIFSEFFNKFQALGIDKGKWIMLFLATTSLSSLASGYLVDKTQKKITLVYLAAPIVALLTIIFFWLNYETTFLFSILIGLTVGLIPVGIGAYFADQTQPEDRGRIMGISVGISMILAQIFLITGPLNLGSASTNLDVLIIGVLPIIALSTLAFRSKDNKESPPVKIRKGPSLKKIALYAVPIFLFYIVVGILLSIVFPTIQDQINSSLFYAIWAIPFMIGAIVAGVQFDFVGRRFPTIIGLAITGVSVAILGILGVNLAYLVVIPLAIGFSYVAVSSLIIWADLAPANSRGLFYGVGFGIIAASQMVGLILGGVSFGSASNSQINAYMLFSSIALFLCIPPLLFAEEALPKELIEKRQLADYLDGFKGKFGKKKPS